MKRIALILTLTACGHEGGSGGDAAQTTAPTAAPATSLQSIALNTAAELPECTAANETQLAYVVDAQLFYVCRSTQWTEVAIKGADGAAGKDGAAGTNGKDGVDGKDAVQVARNEWIDPFTGRHWYLGGAVAGGGKCGGARTPTNAEAEEAVEHGIFQVVAGNAPQDMWTATGQVLNANHAYSPTSGAHGNLCIKE